MRPPTWRRSSGAPSIGADRAGKPGRHVVAGVRAAPLPQHPQGGPDRCVEASDLVVAQRVRGPGRIDACPPERLVGEQIAEAGDARLVHQHGLHRRGASGDHRREVGTGERHGIGTEAVLVGIELHRAEAARVTQVERPAVGEAQPEPTPRRLVAVAAYSSGSPAASPSMRMRPLIPRCSPSTGPPSLVSTSSSFPRRRASRSTRPGRALRTAGGVRPRLRKPRVGRVHGRDLAIERLRLDQRSGLLGLQDLGHPVTVWTPCGALAPQDVHTLRSW